MARPKSYIPLSLTVPMRDFAAQCRTECREVGRMIDAGTGRIQAQAIAMAGRQAQAGRGGRPTLGDWGCGQTSTGLVVEKRALLSIRLILTHTLSGGEKNSYTRIFCMICPYPTVGFG